MPMIRRDLRCFWGEGEKGGRERKEERERGRERLGIRKAMDHSIMLETTERCLQLSDRNGLSLGSLYTNYQSI